MTWQPVPGHIMTRWAKDVTPEAAWPEYPRPQMVRPDWLNLNGLWQVAIAPKDALVPADYDGEILVPFPVESALSGVKRPLLPDQRLWYRRTFVVPDAWRGRRVLLHFGAVDWEAEVRVNGQPAGSHRGGWLPFSFDITPLLRAGENRARRRCEDPDRQFLAAARQAGARTTDDLVHRCLGHLADRLAGAGARCVHRRSRDDAGYRRG